MARFHRETKRIDLKEQRDIQTDRWTDRQSQRQKIINPTRGVNSEGEDDSDVDVNASSDSDTISNFE